MLASSIFSSWRKTGLALLLLASTLSIGFEKPSQSLPETFTVMSYNIRYLNGSDGINHWNLRKEHIISSIMREVRPHIIGFQEVLNPQLTDLELALRGYAHVGVGRDDGDEAGEYAPIFYKRDRLHLTKSGTFWLSSTPEKPSKGWDAACNRIVTWAQFLDQSTDQQLLVFNTHFDHQGETARWASTNLLARKMLEISGGRACIVLGDFNFAPDDPNYQLLQTEANIEDTYREDVLRAGTPEFTFPGNGFDVEGDGESKRIDYIFHTPQFDVLETAILDDSDDGRYFSDHLPVVVRLRDGTRK